jgi:transposase
MESYSTFVGLDVHKDSIQVAMLAAGSSKPIEWSMRNDAKAAGRLVRKLRKHATGQIVCCYEAGPCGYGFQRQMSEQAMKCIVVAPSLIPIRPGQRIKTDRRDARKLAGFLRAGELTEVAPPTPEQEALRDLCRARTDAKQDLMRCRHRLSKMLLRRGLHYQAAKKNWTRAHRVWLRSLSFTYPSEQAVFDDYLRAVEQLEERIKGLDEKLEAASQCEPYAQAVGRLRCFRGIDTVTAVTIVAELHGIERFESARKLMAYLGLVPSEHSSGGKRRQGAITKTGNSHARRMLVEASWHYRHKPSEGAKLRARRQGQAGWVISVADSAQVRLHRRYWRMLAGGKVPNVATVAVARELVGFIWDVLRVQAPGTTGAA